jgi:hypothetical protein
MGESFVAGVGEGGSGGELALEGVDLVAEAGLAAVDGVAGDETHRLDELADADGAQQHRAVAVDLAGAEVDEVVLPLAPDARRGERGAEGGASERGRHVSPPRSQCRGWTTGSGPS